MKYTAHIPFVGISANPNKFSYSLYFSVFLEIFLNHPLWYHKAMCMELMIKQNNNWCKKSPYGWRKTIALSHTRTKPTKVVMSVFWSVKSPIHKIKALTDFFSTWYKWINKGQTMKNWAVTGNKFVEVIWIGQVFTNIFSKLQHSMKFYDLTVQSDPLARCVQYGPMARYTFSIFRPDPPTGFSSQTLFVVWSF